MKKKEVEANKSTNNKGNAKAMFWFALALGVYGISMAGTVYNAIHKPPPFYRHPSGQTLYIYPSPRMQFVYEGYLMAGLLIGAALIWIVGVKLISSTKNHWNQRLFFFLCFGSFAFLAQIIRNIFRGKYGGYPF